jgi:hypothetical protein
MLLKNSGKHAVKSKKKSYFFLFWNAIFTGIRIFYYAYKPLEEQSLYVIAGFCRNINKI